MKSLFIITTYAPTLDKQELLLRCIESIKLSGFDIMVVSHAPIPENIIKLVNFYVYDSDNRFSKCSTTMYWKSANNVTVNRFAKNSHEFPILKLIRNAHYLAQANEYDFFYSTDFDNIFSTEDIEKLLEFKRSMLKENKELIFFYNPDASWTVDGVTITGVYYDLGVFGGMVNTFIDAFDSYFPKTIEQYNDTLGFIVPGRPQCLEHYFYNAFKYKMHKVFIVDGIAKQVLNTSTLNASGLMSTVSLIMPAQDGKHYLYVNNDNTSDYIFEIYYDNAFVDKCTLNGTYISTSFRIFELPSECNVQVKVIYNNTHIDTHELVYKKDMYPILLDSNNLKHSEDGYITIH